MEDRSRVGSIYYNRGVVFGIISTEAIRTAQEKYGKGRPMTGDEIRKLREQAHLSQAVFARYLNLTVGYVSQLERGAKRPSGPALVLLNVIRRKGIEVIL